MLSPEFSPNFNIQIEPSFWHFSLPCFFLSLILGEPTWRYVTIQLAFLRWVRAWFKAYYYGSERQEFSHTDSKTLRVTSWFRQLVIFLTEEFSFSSPFLLRGIYLIYSESFLVSSSTKDPSVFRQSFSASTIFHYWRLSSDDLPLAILISDNLSSEPLVSFSAWYVLLVVTRHLFEGFLTRICQGMARNIRRRRVFGLL
jgi:hypothetical protein